MFNKQQMCTSCTQLNIEKRHRDDDRTESVGNLKLHIPIYYCFKRA